MRHAQYADQPISAYKEVSYLVELEPTVGEPLREISDILQHLGFATGHADFCSRSLNIDVEDLGLISGPSHILLSELSLDQFQAKLNIASETTAEDMQTAADDPNKHAIFLRNELMKLAQTYFNKFRKKLASSNF